LVELMGIDRPQSVPAARQMNVFSSRIGAVRDVPLPCSLAVSCAPTRQVKLPVESV
jgi:hypothetical protein